MSNIINRQREEKKTLVSNTQNLPQKVNCFECFVVMGHVVWKLGWLARWDAPLPGMRRVMGSILWSGNILSWRLVMK